MSQNTQQTPTAQNSTEPQHKNQPVDVQRDGNVKATTWQNESDHGTYYSTSFSKVYQDGNGNFRESKSFSGTDLLKLSMLAQSSYTRANELRREQEQAHGQESAPNKDQNNLPDQSGDKNAFKESRAHRPRRSRFSKKR